MRRRAAAAVVVVTAWCGAPGRVRAACAVPDGIGTAGGTALPERGVLFWFGPSNLAAVTALEGAVWTSEVVQRWGEAEWGFEVRAIHYQGHPASGGALRATAFDRVAASFQLDPDWRAAVRAPQILSVGREHGSWTCSAYDLVVAELDQEVAAVEVRWHGGQTVIVPEHGRAGPVLPLGQLSCGPSLLPRDAFAPSAGMELIAIRHDGSRVRVEGADALTAYLVPPGMVRAPREDADGDRRGAPSSRHVLALRGLALLCVVAIGVRRAGRPRRVGVP